MYKGFLKTKRHTKYTTTKDNINNNELDKKNKKKKLTYKTP